MPTTEQIQNAAITGLHKGEFKISDDNATFGVLPIDYTECDALSCIDHHVLNCGDKEVIMGIFNEKTKDLVFLKIGGVNWIGEGTPQKKVSYTIESW